MYVLGLEHICDETNPRIYAKKYEQNSSNSKHGRLYDRVHACLFCKKIDDTYTNLSSKQTQKRIRCTRNFGIEKAKKI